MNPVFAQLKLAAASANSIALSQTPVSGTDLTINGSAASNGVATLDAARRVLLTFGDEAANRTLVVTGTNRFGSPISETLAVASGAGGTVATVQDFLTVTSLLPLGGGWTAAVTVGTSGVGSTAWIQREWSQLGSLSVLVNVTASGGTYNFEVTWDDINAVQEVYPYGPSVEPQSNVPPIAFTCPGVAYATSAPATALTTGFSQFTASLYGITFLSPYAYRLTQTAGAGTAILQVIETTGDRKDAF